ncbi:MAG: acetylglutamate kinase, partial [Candidatus Omnitrophota bacterium]
RVTDEQTLKVVEEELQKLNTMIVNEITELGCHAIGLNGKENKLLASEKKKANIDLGLVGHVTGVNTKAIFDELDKDKVVVILPMGAGGDGKTYNVNADEAAANVAESMKAEKLVILTNVKGIMRAPDDPSSFMSTLTREDAKQLMEQKVIQTGMIPKVQACIHAVTKGVKKTHMVDACIPHALLLEIFTDQGIGTEIIS